MAQQVRPVLGTLDLGSTDSDGTLWITSTIDWASPASVMTVQQRAKGHGGWANSNQFLGPRSVPISGAAVADDASKLSAAVDRLLDACSLDETKLTVFEAGGVARWCMVYRQDAPLVTQIGDRAFKWSIQVVAPDPRKHQDPVSASTRLPSVTGGLTFPHTIPFTIDSTVITGQVSLTNPGNIEGPVVARIDGPCTGVTAITHVGTGRALKFAEDLSMQAGEFLIIDMENETVLAQGQESRNNFVTERGWSSFDPGVNTWSFSSAGTDLGAKLTVAATPSWK